MKTYLKKYGMVILTMLALTLCLALPQRAQAASMNKKTVTLGVGQKVTLKVNGTAKTPVWSTSNSKIASVSNGRVKAKRTGSAVITAKIGKHKFTCKVTVKGNYRSLYRKYLEKANAPEWFFVEDINRDGLPELITARAEGVVGVYNVYTVSNGKMVRAGSCRMRGVSSNAPYFIYVPKIKSIYCSGWINGIGGSWAQLWAMSGVKLKSTHYIRSEESSRYTAAYYMGTSDKNCKKVSKSKLISYRDKYFKDYGKSPLTYFWKNNASYREEYFVG